MPSLIASIEICQYNSATQQTIPIKTSARLTKIPLTTVTN